ncbi:SWIM zinc finger family protein [Haloarcula salina]|uniref:SWIM zinc finger family protein n=1 Tax=Haloarcula salina TaxID=1429914 RepID=A0AA41G2V0_9EURY|nr:SWIM zinc finger family protein [Haloarcula salina]MBV0902429.1 SWIM zinc finger family protein [Haloarcula salina]
MTLIEPTADRDRTALAPDLHALPDRAARAWTERMAVSPREGSTYAVTTESGHTYLVDVKRRSCSCPDNRIRGERCKHLRRVAIEITARRVAPPGKQRATCDACGTVTFVAEDAPTPHLCERCRLTPGDVARDRETGDRLVVVRVTDERASERVVEATGETVAAYDTNDGYPADDFVVEAAYLSDAVRADDPRRYAFPRSRLERTDERLVDTVDG